MSINFCPHCGSKDPHKLDYGYYCKSCRKTFALTDDNVKNHLEGMLNALNRESDAWESLNACVLKNNGENKVGNYSIDFFT